MDDSRTLSDSLLVAASRELKGKARRAFVAKVCQSLCGGSSPKAEARFGWGRAMVARGLEELDPAHPTLPCTPERLQKRQRLSDWRHRPQPGNDAIKQTTTTI